MTNLEQRRLDALRYQERKDSGLCTKCAAPVTFNRDGSASTTCNTHKRNHGRSPGMPTNYDDFRETPGFIDTPEFREFCDVVHSAALKIGRASIGDLRRALGDRFNERLIFDALDTLCAKGLLRQFLSGSMTRRERRHAAPAMFTSEVAHA